MAATTALVWEPIGRSLRRSAIIDISDGFRVKLIEREYGYDNRREYSQTTRVYGAIDALVPEYVVEEPYQGIEIPYQPEDALNKMRARVWAAWKRGTTAECAARLFTLLADVAMLAGEDELIVPAVALSKITFSQKAGCTMCPCSPGFVLAGQLSSPRGRPLDVYVSHIDDAE